MNDQIAIQYALLRGMQSCSLFNDLNTVLGREYLASKVAQDAVWQTPAASGKQGVGAIVQIPQLLFPKPNSLQREREYSIGIYENADVNWTPDIGTFRSADDWADSVIDFLWNWRLWRAGGLVPAERAVVPDTRWAGEGIVGVRCICVLRQERQQPARCALPTISITDGDHGTRTITLAVADGSDIYYTLDGFSYPSPKTDGTLAGEQAATLYAGPVTALPTGLTVMAAAHQANFLPSQTAIAIT